MLRNTAMVVTIDIGNPEDVHPTNKHDVGARLALAGRAVAYGEAIEYSGPLFGRLPRTVPRSESGSTIRPEGCRRRAQRYGGFEIAGVDGQFHSAEAKIDGASVIVSSDRRASTDDGPLWLGEQPGLQSV